MIDYVAEVQKIRASEHPHHNCCQAVMVVYAEEMGMTPQQAYDIGTHFGAGMGCGGTCGVVTGGMMALGAMQKSRGDSGNYMRYFMEKYGALDCRTLLAKSHDRGEIPSTHCDNLIYDTVAYLSALQVDDE